MDNLNKNFNDCRHWRERNDQFYLSWLSCSGRVFAHFRHFILYVCSTVFVSGKKMFAQFKSRVCVDVNVRYQKRLLQLSSSLSLWLPEPGSWLVPFSDCFLFGHQRVEEEFLIKNSSACKDYLIEAMKYHLLPADQRALMKTARTRMRTPVSCPKVQIVTSQSLPFRRAEMFQVLFKHSFKCSVASLACRWWWWLEVRRRRPSEVLSVSTLRSNNGTKWLNFLLEDAEQVGKPELLKLPCDSILAPWTFSMFFTLPP